MHKLPYRDGEEDVPPPAPEVPENPDPGAESHDPRVGEGDGVDNKDL